MYEASGQWSTTQSLSPQPLTDWWERRGSGGERRGVRGLHTNHSQINSPLPQSTILPPFSLPHLFVFCLLFLSVAALANTCSYFLIHWVCLPSQSFIFSSHLYSPSSFDTVCHPQCLSPSYMSWKKGSNSFLNLAQIINDQIVSSVYIKCVNGEETEIRPMWSHPC